MPQYEKRLAHVRQAMAERGIDLLFLPPSANLHYLVGIRRQRRGQTDMIFPGDAVRGAFMSVDRGPILTVPRLAAEVLQRNAQDKPWIEDVRVCQEQDDPDALLRGVLETLGMRGGHVAIEDRAWAASVSAIGRALPDAHFTMASEIIAPIRRIKDEDEVASLRNAGRVAEAVFREVIGWLRPGVTEFDVASEIERLALKHGTDGCSCDTGVRFMRPNHARSLFVKLTDARLQHGDSISFDFGVWHDGYCSDGGTTVFFGEPTQEFHRIHEIVCRAQHAAVAAMKSGAVTAEQLDAVARDIIVGEGYGPKFVHRLGHGIGLDVHEAPFLDKGDRTVLEAGMVFAVEPSINLGHVGCRAEDLVVVRDHGGELLTGYSRDLFVAG